jgi:serine/threonine-protein kinase pkaA
VAGIATVVVVCLVLVAGGLFLWQRHRSQAALAGTFASLPGKAKVVELRHITDVSDYTSAPGGGALAVKSSGEWSLYDLDSSDQAPTWTGKCDKVRFWNNTTLACKGTSDAMTLVSLDGSTSDDVPGPAGHHLMGSDGEHAVLIEGDAKSTSSPQGSLVAIDKDGKESWRSEGHFSKARVRNGFVLAYEGHSKRLYVLSAATGDVLYSQAVDTAPDFARTGSGSRDPGPGDEYFEPGGINLDAGTNAFVVRGSSSATVYDSKGDQVAVISSDTSQDPAWAISANREAKDFADDLSKVEGASGAFAVVGAGASVPVEADAGSCEVSRTDKKVVFTPPEGACSMRPMGLIGGDSAALFAMGNFTSSTSGTSLDATDAYAVAYDLKTGEQLWQAAGIPARALPPSSNASGNAAGQPRMLMLRGTSSSGELVIDAVVPS